MGHPGFAPMGGTAQFALSPHGSKPRVVLG
jgi:hypothetical protein